MIYYVISLLLWILVIAALDHTIPRDKCVARTLYLVNVESHYNGFATYVCYTPAYIKDIIANNRVVVLFASSFAPYPFRISARLGCFLCICPK